MEGVNQQHEVLEMTNFIYPKSDIMKMAWADARNTAEQTGQSVKKFIGTALKAAWAVFKQAMAAVSGEEKKMVALTGSEKQTAWAEKIRSELEKLIEFALTVELKTGDPATGRRSRLAKNRVYESDAVAAAKRELSDILAQPSASFWIECRYINEVSRNGKHMAELLGAELMNAGGTDGLYNDRKTIRAGAAMLDQAMGKINGAQI